VTHWPLLSILIWLPILGGVCTLRWAMPARGLRAGSRWLRRGHLPVQHPAVHRLRLASPAMQFVEQLAWIPAYDIHYTSARMASRWR
jgi:NADH-quinone oxidoreductase subunit M